MEIKEILSRLNGVKKLGEGYMALCPAHRDKNPSLSVGVSEDDNKILLNCFAGCSREQIVSAMGIKMSDLFIRQTVNRQIKEKTPYKYCSRDGTLCYTKTRIDFDDGTKSFYFTQPNGTKGLKGVRRVPYNLPAVCKSDKVYFVEGEKCAEAINKKGYCATTLDSGSNSKWLSKYNKYFEGKEIIIIPDVDEPGMKYAKCIAKELKNARIVPLPQGNKKRNSGYDVADWLRDGGIIEELDNAPILNNIDMVEDIHRSNSTDGKKTQTEILLELIEREGIELYVGQSNSVYATIPINGHTEIWSLESSSFSEWMQGTYYKEERKVIRAEGIKQALVILTAKAKYEKRQDVVLFNRVAGGENAIWYDLSNRVWQAVQITSEKWMVVDNPPILFERYGHQKEQVLPKSGGNIQKIFQYVNLKEYHVLFLCWLVSCFVPEIPHAMSIIYGEKGSAKSTVCTLLKRLIDPSELDHLALPNDQRELVVNLAQHWYVPFDNISSLTVNISDMLCRAITGAGIQQRKLCTNAEDYIFTFQRCISLNGINNMASRADLLDRSLLFELTRIAKTERKELREIFNTFESDRAEILGGIFDILVKAMALFESVKLDKLPRMADFARWGYAIGEALGGYGNQFLQEYEMNQSLRDFEAISSDIVATLLVAFMKQRRTWTGFVGELLVELKKIAPSCGMDQKSKGLPTQPNVLSRHMNDLKSNLEAVGITYTKVFNAKGTEITLSNAKISPLPPYRVDSGKIPELKNGDKQGDI